MQPATANQVQTARDGGDSAGPVTPRFGSRPMSLGARGNRAWGGIAQCGVNPVPFMGVIGGREPSQEALGPRGFEPRRLHSGNHPQGESDERIVRDNERPDCRDYAHRGGRVSLLRNRPKRRQATAYAVAIVRHSPYDHSEVDPMLEDREDRLSLEEAWDLRRRHIRILSELGVLDHYTARIITPDGKEM